MSPQDEILDIVDDNDVVIGSKPRSEIQSKGLMNFRVINAFVINQKGEIWIPRRSATKRIFPLCLDMSVGGHVESGETYDYAFRRETKEELNIDIDKVSYRLLGKLTPKDNLVSAFMQVYEIKVDKEPDYNKDDFVECFWFTPQAYFDHVVKGEKVKGDLSQLVRKFYLL